MATKKYNIYMQLRLKTTIPQTTDISTFIFTPTKKVSWEAGQSIKIEVAGTYGPIEHRFTISSAPHEQTMAITTRNSGSTYKKRLFALQPGDEVRAFAIEGDFIWKESSLPKIWIAAGIGITPFYAMLQDRAFKNLPLHLTLLYSSRGEVVFKKELDALAAHHPEFELHYVGSRTTAADILAEPQAKQRPIYLSGPSAMVDQLGEQLLSGGVNSLHLVRDWFTGRLDLEG